MSTIYLIPSLLSENAMDTIPAYILPALKECSVVFAENERTARRFFKLISRDIVIDDYEWFTIHKSEKEEINNFRKKIEEKKNIAIISEAGCPGIADPGQVLIGIAQEMDCSIKPLVGPNSILLALMGSGMNGQQFEFVGYLPIESIAREKMLRDLEQSSEKNNSTKIFIETPYRNNQLLESILKVCRTNTRLCIAVNLTAADEAIKTKSILNWKSGKPDIHKQPAIFLLYAGK
ncbi:MAG: SAM-dependent methyltransferase [Ferruginibacter sp.]